MVGPRQEAVPGSYRCRVTTTTCRPPATNADKVSRMAAKAARPRRRRRGGRRRRSARSDRRRPPRRAQDPDGTRHHRTAASATQPKSDTVEINLKKALDFVADVHRAYLDAPARTRRLMNQAIFERFLVTDDEEVTGTLAGPFDLLIEAPGRTPGRRPRPTWRCDEARIADLVV